MSEEIKTFPSKPSIFDSTIFVALISGLGYLASFYYESAFLDYYGIPNDFVTLDLNAIVIASSGILIGFVCLLGIMSMFSILGFLDNHTPRARQRLIHFVILVIIIFIAIMTPPQNNKTWIVYSVAFAANLLPTLIPWLYYKFFKPNIDYDMKLEEMEKKDLELEKNSILSKLLSRHRWVSGIILAAILTYLIASTMGYKSAKDKNEYWTISLRPNQLIVRMNQKEIILLPYDESENKLGNKIDVLDRAYLYSTGINLESKKLKPQINK